MPNSFQCKSETQADAKAMRHDLTFVSEGRLAYARHIQTQTFILWLNDLIGNGPLLTDAGSFFFVLC